MKLVTIVTILAIAAGIADAVPRPRHVGRGRDLMRRKDKSNKGNKNSNKGGNSDGGNLEPLCKADADGFGKLANGK